MSPDPATTTLAFSGSLDSVGMSMMESLEPLMAEEEAPLAVRRPLQEWRRRGGKRVHSNMAMLR